jgi:hypothetical protein
MISNILCGIGAPMLVAAASALVFTYAVAADATYAGQQNSPIKSLPEQEVAALLAGQGPGLAKAAELNGYPGPGHVLELATALHLTDSQLRATEALMSEHRARARELGSELVAAESELDQLFQNRLAVPDRVDRATEKIAMLQTRLRAEHPKTHLAQSGLLDSQQTHLCQTLCGYVGRPDQGKDVPVPTHQHHGGSGSRP